ncbi:TetR/AcrR family transcriptional regulator [Psychrobacillus sp. OK032]|uniref:TetR/AcrR family transcriptional regulator n=1 Tax=Psychrobacillus sp. OK032 TaxID=1884358 RepID=UPI0008C2DE77|nr:TetR/AcrR family transcriptional regulator [Psychrobacillus sp. OK032]SER86461.1 transcriptional regulator, TetR family [Psychrobacillus sp. OK032]
MTLREKKVAKKKEDILKSAASILAEKGYFGTTMEEIAASLLMTKGSIYYYFKDKQDLLYQSQKVLLEQSLINIEEISRMELLSPKEKLGKAMFVHLEFLISELSTFAMGIKPEQVFTGEYLEEILRLRVKYADCFDELITEGIESGDFKSVNVTISRNIILGAMNWVVQWYSPEKKGDAEIAEMISEYLLQIFVKNEK